MTSNKVVDSTVYTPEDSLLLFQMVFGQGPIEAPLGLERARGDQREEVERRCDGGVLVIRPRTKTATACPIHSESPSHSCVESWVARIADYSNVLTNNPK